MSVIQILGQCRRETRGSGGGGLSWGKGYSSKTNGSRRVIWANLRSCEECRPREPSGEPSFQAEDTASTKTSGSHKGYGGDGAEGGPRGLRLRGVSRVGGVVEHTEMGSCWRALSRQCFSQSRQGQGRQQGWPGTSVSWEAVMETFIRVKAVSECWTPCKLCPEGLDAEREGKRAPPTPGACTVCSKRWDRCSGRSPGAQPGT